MKNPIAKYLERYAEQGTWTIRADTGEEIRNVVVIPALAEYPTLLATLHSLAKNDPYELCRTLVACVVNNRPYPQASQEDIANNRQTLTILEALQAKRAGEPDDSKERSHLEAIRRSALRLALIDASSPGRELPPHGGVGLARKIGMDLSLALLARQGAPERCLLLSLDADTLVEPGYLSAVSSYFDRSGDAAAVVSFAHREGENRAMSDAIAYYEASLRYYVAGLRYARSPYAFHTIGSTMVATARGYALVRGIPKRLAAEDFYFLNKLAKVGTVGRIDRTTVHPSPRHSTRTPFGTGNKIGKLLQDESDPLLFYNPDIFPSIRVWLNLIAENTGADGQGLMTRAARIDPSFPAFLDRQDFPAIWRKLQDNFPDPGILRRQFHVWFDGLKTLKLVHYLTENGYPKIPPVAASLRLGSVIRRHVNAPDHARPANIRDLPAYLESLEQAAQIRGAV